MLHRELLIGGVFLGGPCDQGIGKTVQRSPYDGSIVGTAAEAGRPEAEQAVLAAREAFPTWRHTAREQRRELLQNVAESIRARRDELAELMALEIGKPVSLALGELDRCALTFDLAAQATEMLAPESFDLTFDTRGKGYSGSAQRFPIGPVLCITPYNWPFNLAAHKIAPALAAGNTVILKGSPLSALCSLTLARLIHEAGFPPGVLNAIQGEPPIAEWVARHPEVAMVSFTGSPAVGFHLKEMLPHKRVALELGGDAFAIVCADSDLDWAASRCAAGAYGYAGQVCISVQHVLAEGAIYESFRDKLIAATDSTPTGDPRDRRTICGPLMTNDAADRVLAWIDEAEQSGARILAGGNRIGNVIEPTLVEAPAEVAGNPKLFTEEVFGPVLTLRPYQAFEAALHRVNASQFGLQVGLFTNHEERIARAYDILEVGGLVVGDFPTLRFDNMPYGGVKRSGFGREGVRFAIEEMTEWRSFVRREQA